MSYYEDYDEGFMDPYDDDRPLEFAQPGSGSALRAATAHDPRNRPCPTCQREDVLTTADVRQGYQCDRCADAAEGMGGF